MHNKPLNGFFLVLLAGLWFLPGARAEDDLLLPDQAFRISGESQGADAVAVEWAIADGYYLYREKFKFFSETLGIELGEPELPPSLTKHDEFFGDVEVYRDRVRVNLPVHRAQGAQDILTLQATSQGCADRGICYPPHTQTILLALAEIATEEPPAPEDKPRVRALEALNELGRDLGLGGEDDILDPQEAFGFSASVEGPQELRLDWRVAEGTYLYKEKIELALKDTTGVELGRVRLPPGKVKHDSVRPDGSIGDVEVYEGNFQAVLPLLRSTADAAQITLVSKFQGCADIGICYPPMTEQVSLKLPPAEPGIVSPTATPQTAEPAEAEPVAEQDRIAAMLVGGNAWAIVASFFGVGLLLAFTPCVFPMVPILSGIIAGQGRRITTRKAFILSLVYVLAMAATYTVAGVLAGLFGENLQAAFQNPLILSAFALVFVLLALSMFGFYELQLPSAWQSKLSEISSRQHGGTLIGVAIMGLLSALIVGPCVAPPLAGALIYIGQTGDALLGGLALFALSLGMGTPLVAIGTSAGKLLPRAGAWMDAVKSVFGVLMLAVAIILLERIVAEALAMLLWGSLLIVSAVYMGALKSLPVEASGWSRLWKGLGVVILVYGALMLVGAAAGGKDTLQPLRGLLPASLGAAPGHVTFRRIKSESDLERELAAAGTLGKPSMLDFYADWCVACKEMERYTFSDPGVAAALSEYVLLQADVTANDAEDQALLQGRFGLPGPPAIMFFGADGVERKNFRVVGFMPADQFAGHVRQAAR